MGEANHVFISYSHRDREWLDRVKIWLKPLADKGLIDPWDDGKIEPGTKWRDEIANHLESAGVALLLVTQNFLASDFITKNELPPLLEAAEARGLRVLWVAVGSSTFEDTKIAEYQGLNDPEKPLALLSDPERDAVLLEIYKRIKAVLEPDGAGP